MIGEKRGMGKSSKNLRFLPVRPSLAKRGQFYLIAAVVLATVIIGISAISNYSKKESSPDINEFKEEIKIESAKTLDYGTNNNLGSTAMYQLMQNFTSYYVGHETRSGKDIYFIFGNENNVTVSGYQSTAKVVSIVSGSSQATITQASGSFTGGIDPNANTLTLFISQNQYSFNLNTGENFYFALIQNVNGAEYVVTG